MDDTLPPSFMPKDRPGAGAPHIGVLCGCVGEDKIVYRPTGTKLAVMKGQTIQQAFVPLPGGTTAEYLSWRLSYYRHPDWLGSERLESSTSHSTWADEKIQIA